MRSAPARCECEAATWELGFSAILVWFCSCIFENCLKLRYVRSERDAQGSVRRCNAILQRQALIPGLVLLICLLLWVRFETILDGVFAF